MGILIGIAVFLAALYWWLIGHWFARVVMLFPFAAVICLVVGLPAHSALFGLIVGAALAWPLASIPIYYWRWQYRRDHQLSLGVSFD